MRAQDAFDPLPARVGTVWVAIFLIMGSSVFISVVRGLFSCGTSGR
jgi:hypothetical protein